MNDVYAGSVTNRNDRGPAAPVMALPGRTTHDDSAAAVARRLHALLRGRYLAAITLACLGSAIGGGLGYLLPTPSYRSEGLIRIQPVLPKIIERTEQNEMPPMFTSYVKTQANLLQTSRVIDKAMQSDEWSSLRRGLSPDAQDEFRKSLSVVNFRDDPEWIRVYFVDREPKAAQIGVAAVIQAYEDIYGKDELVVTPSTIKILEDRKRSTEIEIARLQDNIAVLANEFGTTELGDLHAAQLETAMRLDQALREAEQNLANSRAIQPAAGANGAPSDGPSADITMLALQLAAVDPSVKSLLDEERRLKGAIQRMKAAGLGEKHRDMRAASAELSGVQAQIKDAVDLWRTGGAASGLEPGASNLAQLESLVQSLRERTTQARTRAIDIDTKRRRIEEIRGDIRQLEDKLAATNQRLDAINTESMAANLPGVSGRINIIDRGQVPHSPFVDNRLKLGALGVMAGAGVPLAAVLGLGILDRRYRFSDDAKSTRSSVTLLGILPRLPDDLRDPEQVSVAAHCVHQIRTLLQIGGEHSQRRIFSVTSPTAGDGKTSLALSLGLSFAQSGSRTLLIDFDMIGGGLTSAMRAKSDRGLLDAIDGGDIQRHIRTTWVDRLWLLPIGRHDAEHVGRLSPQSVRQLIRAASAQYDTVIIDTGPILGSLEASLVSAEVDGVILAVGRGQQKGMAERAFEHLSSVGARLMGVVFNRAEPGDFKRAVSSASVRSTPTEVVEKAIVPADAAQAEQLAKLGPMPRTVAAIMHPS